MVYCCVPCCTNSSKKKCGLSFHKFPKDNEMRQKWIVNIRRDPGRDFKLHDATVVCSAHFKPESFTFKGYTNKKDLKADAAPTIFDWGRSPKKRKAPDTRTSLPTKKRLHTCEDETATTPSDPVESVPSSGSSPIAGPSQDHDYHVEETDACSQLKAAQEEIERLQAQVVVLTKERCFYTRLSRDPTLVSFYTGFKDYDTLMDFYRVIEPSATVMIHYSQYCRLQNGETQNIRPGMSQHSLPLIEQFLLVLRYLRVGTFEKELADSHHTSESTVSRLIISWLNYLYFVLGSVPLWPSVQQVKDHMPSVFADYPHTRVILDCTEIWVQRSASLVLNTEFYSQYKGTTTLKGLVGIVPSGAVSFVSKLYPGSISDKAITRAAGVLDLLQPGDEVMVDKGFKIADLLETKGAKLVIPPFLTGLRPQLERQEVSETQSIARVRVHVERAIRRVKTFHVFDRVVPLTMAGTVNQMWSVCCLLTNFQGVLL